MDFEKRVLGCLILLLMPSVAVDEAVESLRDTAQFWVQRQNSELPRPTQWRAAEVISRSERPNLIYSD